MIGIDSNLHIWSVVDTTVGGSDESRKPSSGGGKGGSKKKGGSSGPKVEFTARLEKVWSVAHGSKINALATDGLTIIRTDESGSNCSSSSDRTGATGRLFVADMTSDISVYDFSQPTVELR